MTRKYTTLMVVSITVVSAKDKYYFTGGILPPFDSYKSFKSVSG
jgi:hypothetical protein